MRKSFRFYFQILLFLVLPKSHFAQDNVTVWMCQNPAIHSFRLDNEYCVRAFGEFILFSFSSALPLGSFNSIDNENNWINFSLLLNENVKKSDIKKYFVIVCQWVNSDDAEEEEEEAVRCHCASENGKTEKNEEKRWFVICFYLFYYRFSSSSILAFSSLLFVDFSRRRFFPFSRSFFWQTACRVIYCWHTNFRQIAETSWVVFCLFFSALSSSSLRLFSSFLGSFFISVEAEQKREKDVAERDKYASNSIALSSLASLTGESKRRHWRG